MLTKELNAGEVKISEVNARLGVLKSGSPTSITLDEAVNR